MGFEQRENYQVFGKPSVKSIVMYAVNSGKLNIFGTKYNIHIVYILRSIQLKSEDFVAWSRVLAPSGRGGEFRQPSLRLLAEYMNPVMYKSHRILIKSIWIW